jgi:hypothetical protein
VLDFIKILRLSYGKKLSGREIAELQGCGKTAINDFLKRFRESDDFSYPLAPTVTNELINQTLYKSRGGSNSRKHFREFDCEQVYKKLPKKGETLKHLWLKYDAAGPVIQDDGSVHYPYSYRQFCKIYADWCEQRNVTSRIPRYPAQNCELDFAGMALYLKNKLTGEKSTKVTIFVATMSYSNYCYAEGIVKANIQNWIAANNHAFQFFGGMTPIVTNDNCKVAVIKNTDWIDPVTNKDFQEWADHNNTVLYPAKVKSPRWKPHVENSVRIINEHILIDMKDMTFFSLEELNAVLWEKIDEMNALRLTTKDCSRWDIFSTEEQEHLLPLPSEAYQYLERKVVRVYQDFHIRFDDSFYSIPKKYVKKKVELRASSDTLQIYSEAGTYICNWKRSSIRGTWNTNPDHLPYTYKDYLQWSKPNFQQWASKIGPYTRSVIDAQFNRVEFPEQAFRRCRGILGFTKKYSSKALETACEHALLRGVSSYAYIKNTIGNFYEPEKTTDAVHDKPLRIFGYKSNDSQYALDNLISHKEDKHE